MKRIAVLIICLSLVIISFYPIFNSNESYDNESRSDAWWNQDWAYRKKITINHTFINEPLTNFPLLINNSSNDYINHAQSDGDDFIFIDNTQTMIIPHEIEYYNSTNGELITWMNISQIASDVDTNIYLYYGNPNVSSQQNANNTWNNNFKGVWHFHHTPMITVADSTMNNNNGTAYGSMNNSNLVDGKVGKCFSFDGVNNYVSIPDSTSLKPTDLTLSAWIKTKQEQYDSGEFISKCCHDVWGNSDGTTYGFFFTSSPDNIILGTFEKDQYGQQERVGFPSYVNNTWYHLVLTFNESSDDAELFVNGESAGIFPICHHSILWYHNPWSFVIGGCRNGDGSSHTINRFHNIDVDEIRVMDKPVSDAWIYAEYHNQEGSNHFLTIGQEETVPTIIDMVHVDDDYTSSTPGWQLSHFDSIQDGIDAVAENGTVHVYNGTYYENVIVNKTIDLIGEDRNVTIIDGGENGNVISITEENVFISSFTIQNSSDGAVGGIEILADNSTINNNFIQDNRHGIYPCYSNNSTISVNYIMNNHDGVRCFNSSRNYFDNNIITSNNNMGIYLKGNSNNNILVNNTISSNSFDGIHIYSYCHDNIIYDNEIKLNGDYGIYIYYSSYSSNDNIIYHNNLMNNIQNARDECNNIWYFITINEGNYYSDFDEPSEGAWDNNSDCIVDTPYNISGGTNQDLYPIMYPYGEPVPDFNMTLHPGWNNIGWYHSDDTMASTLMDNISSCIIVSWYDPVNQTFRSRTSSGGYDFVITRGLGIFVYTTEYAIWHGEG